MISSARESESARSTQISSLEYDAYGLSGQGGPLGTTWTGILYAMSLMMFRDHLDLALSCNSIGRIRQALFRVRHRA